MAEITVYTAVTRGYDALSPVRGTATTRYVAFVEDLRQSTNGWELRPLLGEHADPNRRAKRYKLLPWACLPGAECSLWLDGSMGLSAGIEPSSLVSRYLSGADLAVRSHGQRVCAYDEADVVAQHVLDDVSVVRAQMKRYRAEGFPRRHGLAEAGAILRRHTASQVALGDAWWSEIERGSRRDQLSFNYVCWKLGEKYVELDRRLFVGRAHTKSSPKLRRSVLDYIYRR